MSDLTIVQKKKIINHSMGIEGGYSDNPSDSGGQTKYGITEYTARRHGYTGPMKDLPYDVGFKIYEDDYWDAIMGDKMLKVSFPITAKLFDAGINISPRRIIAMLQRSLNLLTESKLTVDGIIGSKTINSLQGYMDKRNSAKTLLKLIDGFQTTYYAELAEERPKDRAFIYGWIKNRINETLKLY